ncbi:carbohydrate porin, partial [Salmonella enterica]|nr:carbohydrate porin [Salmonella enterica]
MKAKNVKLSLLCIFIGMALYPADVLASKLTVEQRLELLESELSANKKELQITKYELSTYKNKIATLQKSVAENSYRNTAIPDITATSPVSENINNENGEINQSGSHVPVKGTQQVAVIDSNGK